MLNYDKAEAAVAKETERHKEFIDALYARRGQDAGDAYRRMSELLWLARNLVPPEEIITEHPEHIKPTLTAIQDKMLTLLSSALIKWLEAVEGHEITEGEMQTTVIKEIETILDSIQASEGAIFRAAMS